MHKLRRWIHHIAWWSAKGRRFQTRTSKHEKIPLSFMYFSPISTSFAGRFHPYVSGGVFDCAASTTSGWGTQLPSSRWPPPTRDLQALSGARCPQRIIWHQLVKTCKPIPASAPSPTAAPAAASSPWLPTRETREETLLRTPQAMYVREPPFPSCFFLLTRKVNYDLQLEAEVYNIL